MELQKNEISRGGPKYIYARIAVREQIIKFSGELSAGLPKVVRRFIAESLYGIQARQSVRLTEIARSLEEEIPLRKTQYRLCRQLGRAVEPNDAFNQQTGKKKPEIHLESGGILYYPVAHRRDHLIHQPEL